MSGDNNRNTEPLHEVEIDLLENGKPWKTRYFPRLTIKQIEEWEAEYARTGYDINLRVRRLG